MARLAPDILAVLSRFLSDTNARLVFERALARLKLAGDPLSPGDRRLVIDELKRAAKLFLDPTQLARLHTAISLRAGEHTPRVEPFALDVLGENDISIARVQARRLCEQLGAPPLVVQKVATVVSELARNIVEYTPGGRIELTPEEAPRPRISVLATDHGSGIANLDAILAGRYVSKTGLGVGLVGSKRLATRFDVQTGVAGTRIEAEVAW